MKIIGIDPDVNKYGIAVFEGAKLASLCNLDIVEFVEFIGPASDAIFVIEDVMFNSFIYQKNVQKCRNKNSQDSINAKIAQNVGACKHSQTVAELFIEKAGAKVVKIPPMPGNWAKDKERFERITGWKGRSNDDNRSAAFFAFTQVGKHERNDKK